MWDLKNVNNITLWKTDREFENSTFGSKQTKVVCCYSVLLNLSQNKSKFQLISSQVKVKFNQISIRHCAGTFVKLQKFLVFYIDNLLLTAARHLKTCFLHLLEAYLFYKGIIFLHYVITQITLLTNVQKFYRLCAVDIISPMALRSVQFRILRSHKICFLAKPLRPSIRTATIKCRNS